MKVQVEELSPVSQKLTIEVDAAQVEQELARAYRELSSRVTVPGFRPGKIPRRLLEQKYRPEVEADVVRRVQMKAFLEAVSDKKVEAVGEPAMSAAAVLPGQPFAFTAVVDVRPKVVAQGYRGLALSRVDATVSDQQLEEQLMRLRESKATLAPVVVREVAETGDVAIVDFEATIDGKPFPGSTGHDIEVSVTPGELIEGHQAALAGVAIGGKATFDYMFPAAYRVEEIQGRTARCVATLKAIKARVVPQLDDEFARSVGADSAEALRGSMRRDLERAARERARNQERDEIFKKLVEQNPFELPAAMVASGIDVLLENVFGGMMRSGVDPRTLRLDWVKVREELRPRAEFEVRGQLLVRAICAQEHLDVTDEDIEKHLVELSETVKLPVAALRKQLAGAKERAALVYRLEEDKALALAREHARYEA